MDIELKDINLKEHEPFILDQASVITDLEKFFRTHETSYRHLKKQNKNNLAKLYLDRAKYVKSKIVERLIKENPEKYTPSHDKEEAFSRFSRSQRGFVNQEMSNS